MQFRNLAVADEFIRQAYTLKDTRGWKLPSARKELAQDKNWDAYFTRILYRPFDVRWIYYTPTMIDWGRPEVMRHMLQPNISFVLPRRVETAIPWSHIFISDALVEHVAVSLKTIDYCFPLYSYPDTNKLDLFGGYRSKEQEPNINPRLIAELTKAYKKAPSPENIFNYIYAVFFANAYRKKYGEFLKIEFPRVPFTSDSSIFQRLARIGEELVDIHLLRSKKLDSPTAKCEGKGSLSVEKPTYVDGQKRIYVNGNKFFGPVSRNVWEYHIGGYQVAYKWLKNRKGRTLSSEEVSHYCRMLTALEETIRIQASLDEVFAAAEKLLISIKSF